MCKPFAVIALLLCASGAAADSAPLLQPLYVKNLSPVAALLGLPAQRGVVFEPDDRWEWALEGAIASHYIDDDGAAGERLRLDGETRRLALVGRYRVAGNWELQLEVPWQAQGGGVLDRAIDNWHEFWDMPDNGRSGVPQDLLDYRYGDPSLRFDLRKDSAGLGDISVSAQRQIHSGGSHTAALSVGYKFGSGDPARFTGSGENDAFAALRLSGWMSAQLRWHGQLGYLRAGVVPALAERQRRDVWFAGGALAWQLSPRWALLGQLDAHAAPLDSALAGLGDTAVLLSAGVRWRPARRWALTFSLVEDVAVETGPDVILQAGVSRRGG